MALKRMKGLFILFLGLSMFLSLMVMAQESHNCDFGAVLTLKGYIIPDITQINDPPPPYDDPDDFFYEFIRTCNYNPNGYGIIYLKNGETVIPEEQRWYSSQPYPAGPLDQAHQVIMNPSNHAVMVMAHDRWGTGGWAGGNHPFTFEWNGRTYAFMHNGSISNEIRQALWNELYNWYEYEYQVEPWFDQHPSNWVPAQDTGYWDAFIDSEILFHWIMKNIIDHNNSTFAGLQAALTAEVRTNLPPNPLPIINLHDQFIVPFPNNTINFVLFDGESLYVYRNTPWNGSNHNISYKQFGSGFVGVKTQWNIENGGHQVPQFSLVHITRDASPLEFANFLDLQITELQISMSDSPDPVSEGQMLTYEITITNNGPYDAADVILEDDVPAYIVNPRIVINSSVRPWYGSINLGNLEAGESIVVYICGPIHYGSGPTFPLKITNKAKVSTLAPCQDPEPRNNKAVAVTKTNETSSTPINK
jgi:uncharacterized repeat protein (TIGR01451 family)